MAAALAVDIGNPVIHGRQTGDGDIFEFSKRGVGIQITDPNRPAFSIVDAAFHPWRPAEAAPPEPSDEQFTEALTEGREQVMEALAFMRNHVPGCERAFLVSTAPMIGVRESRRILGDTVLAGEDVQTGRDFEDGIARDIYLLDIHNPVETGARSQLVLLKQPYTIPYRALLPRGIENLLVAGRCISGDHVALASYRVQSHAMAIGEAAGTAAALASAQGVPPRRLSAARLRTALQAAGANIGPR